MKKIIFLSLFALSMFSSINAQTPRAQIYHAFVVGDMEMWKKTMNTFEQQYITDAQKTELINYYYGYIAYQIGIGKKAEASMYLNKAETILNMLLKSNPNKAALYAYKAAFIGFKISISPLKAPFIGKSSFENANKALALDENDIQANIEQANVLYYAPSVFGGNKIEAKKYYLKALQLLETKPEDIKDNWLHLSLMTSLAKIYIDERKYQEAKALCEKILNIEPSYKYVKDELYPSL